jgi:hypothetical protein
VQPTKSQLLYKEKGEIVVKYCHPKSNDYLNYDSVITIKSGGKLPVEMAIKFNGIPTYIAPMPPTEHTFKATSINRRRCQLLHY